MYPVLSQFWLVFGSPIDLKTSFDWKELQFRVLDTMIQSESCLRRLNQAYSPEVIEARSTLSCEALELYKVSVFLASLLGWHRSSRPLSSSIKLLKCAGSKQHPRIHLLVIRLFTSRIRKLRKERLCQSQRFNAFRESFNVPQSKTKAVC